MINKFKEKFKLLKKGHKLNVRIGMHTAGESPIWEPWHVEEVSYAQENQKDETILIVVMGVEMSGENVIGYENDIASMEIGPSVIEIDMSECDD